MYNLQKASPSALAEIVFFFQLFPKILQISVEDKNVYKPRTTVKN